ncbi:glutamate receptor 4-like [Penaeus monodon]|uniref:glutamate receptor 4-like n=1 Tax=Penaeus monodon TaxID=6687 RepID=UPI0018A73E24|nr:glutamate receptor 4-like [Penaeus monodon]
MTSSNNQSCVKITAFMQWPYMAVRGTADNLKVEGSIVEIHKIIFDKLGYCFSYVYLDYFRCPLAALLSGNADMSGVPVAITDEVTKGKMEHSVYVYADELSAMYRRPVLEADISGLFNTYTAYVWWLIIAASLGMLFCVWVMRLPRNALFKKYRGEAGRTDPDNGALSKTFCSTSNFFSTLAVMLAQSIPNEPRRAPARIAFAFWLLVTFVLASVYRSNVKAMLILPKVDLPFNDAEELADTGLPLKMTFRSLLHRSLLKAPPGSTLSRLLPRNDSIYFDMNFSTAFKEMRKGAPVIAASRTVIRNVMHDSFSKTGKCLAYVMTDNLIGMNYYSFVFPKGSPLKAQVDPLIVKLQQSGIMDYVVRKATANATECLKPPQSQYQHELRPLKLRDFYGVFLLHIGGIFVGLLAFLIELAWAKLVYPLMPQPNSRQT